MRKQLIAAGAALLLAAVCTVPALAANQVETLTTDVALRQDGSAHVTQVFSAVTEEGTEFYLDRMDSGYLTYSGFTVSDETGAYTVLDEDAWDIDADFSEKAGKCGLLHIDGGVELCWGITEYGAHTYTVEYDIGGLASAYSDADGFLYRFIDPDQTIFPTEAGVAVYMADGTPLTEDNCGIWAFGFDGQIWFEDGVIYAWTDTPLEGSDYMTIMVGLDKGVLRPEHTAEGTFADLQETAFAGSDYDSGYSGGDDEPITAGDVAWMVGSLAVIAGAVVGIAALVKARKRTKEKKQLAQADYFRDAPNGGDLNVSYALGECLRLCTQETYLAARVLRLITLGSLEPETTGKEAAMRFVREPHNGDSYDEALYTFLEAAAGSDGVLQTKELERFCLDGRHAKTLNDLLETCRHDGELALKRGGCFRGGTCRRVKDLTEKGRREWGELLGLKRYLLDFSLLAERGVAETFLWQEYMVYAALLGIAKQVMAQLRDLYPDQLAQVEQYQQYLYSAERWNRSLYGAVERQQAVRSAGGGGHASFGGGGGFSGGGSAGTR